MRRQNFDERCRLLTAVVFAFSRVMQLFKEVSQHLKSQCQLKFLSASLKPLLAVVDFLYI